MSSDAPDFIKPLHESRIAAILSSDITALTGLLSDDMVHIAGYGTVDTKASYLRKRALTNYIKIRETTYYSLDWQTAGEIVLVRGNMTLREFFPDNFQWLPGPGSDRPPKSGEFTYHTRITEVWRREDGVWRFLHHHECERTAVTATAQMDAFIG